MRLDEPYDLRVHGTEKFIVFRTDRLFKFTIDNRQMEWGKPLISGLIVRRLAAVGDDYAVYLEVRGGQDREINDTDTKRSPITDAAVILGSAGCQPACLGSLPRQRSGRTTLLGSLNASRVVGKLPTPAGWQPALPEKS